MNKIKDTVDNFYKNKKIYENSKKFALIKINKFKTHYKSEYFISKISHLLELANFFHIDLNKDQKIEIFNYLKKEFFENDGASPISKTFAKLKGYSCVKEIYSTYYYFKCLIFLDEIPKKEDLEKLKNFMFKNYNKFGFFNKENSNTNLQYRKHQEFTMQSMFAAEFLIYAQKEGIKLSDQINDLANAYKKEIMNFRGLSSKYYAYNLIKLINKQLIDKNLSKNLTEYVYSRFNYDGGFVDYFPNEKIDESSGHVPRFSKDQNISHIFSTYEAYYLLNELKSLESSYVKKIKVYLNNSPFDAESGYGHQIYVKQFKKPWGKSGSLRETLQLLKFPFI